jgi:F420-0:gamma-glutamyl ligase
MLRMSILPDYIGVSAFGLKMGIIVPGSDVVAMIGEALAKCARDGLLDDGDTVCVTESVVARAQNNYVTTADIAEEVRKKLQLGPTGRIGVLFPILSRNRFALILKGLAAAVPQGEVVVQLSYPSDEVGNQLLPYDFHETLGKCEGELILLEDLGEERFLHPITQVDYIELYNKIVTAQGAACQLILCNDPLQICNYGLDAVVVANVHNRLRTREKLIEKGVNCITLQDLCNSGAQSWSEWGLLGSNLSSGDKLKLAPRDCDTLADQIQDQVERDLGKKVEVIIYGDGAYRDPSTGIYELADPQPTFGMTKGLRGQYREGLKYKYVVDKMLDEGHDIETIAQHIQALKNEHFDRTSIEAEGTTPRKSEDLLSSLADLVSGSADAGTPCILIKGFLRKN